MDLRTAKTLSPREYHARRDAARRAERQALRQARLEQARAAIRGRAIRRASLGLIFDRLRGIFTELEGWPFAPQQAGLSAATVGQGPPYGARGAGPGDW